MYPIRGNDRFFVLIDKGGDVGIVDIDWTLEDWDASVRYLPFNLG